MSRRSKEIRKEEDPLSRVSSDTHLLQSIVSLTYINIKRCISFKNTNKSYNIDGKVRSGQVRGEEGRKEVGGWVHE